MPIYEYVCRACGHEFECLVRDNEQPSCPACGRQELSRQFSAPATQTSATSEPSCASGQCSLSDGSGKR